MLTLTSTHVNSHKVTIYRLSSFMLDAQTERAPDFASMASKSVGPYFAQLGSKEAGSGLNRDEKKLLMPDIIEYDAEDKNFIKEVNNYFHSMWTPVPYSRGVELEIGLLKDNSAPLSKENMPINIQHYIRYRHALAHPHVGADKSSSEGNSSLQYYISDPLQEKVLLVAASKEKDEALAVYFEIKDDPKKVDMYLTLLGEDPRDYGSAGERKTRLQQLTDKPIEFMKVSNADNFDERFLIQSLINAGVLELLNGRQIVDKELNKLIANSMDEAVVVIQAPDFENTISIWKAKKQEADKKKKPKFKPRN